LRAIYYGAHKPFVSQGGEEYGGKDHNEEATTSEGGSSSKWSSMPSDNSEGGPVYGGVVPRRTRTYLHSLALDGV